MIFQLISLHFLYIILLSKAIFQINNSLIYILFSFYMFRKGEKRNEKSNFKTIVFRFRRYLSAT